MNTNRQFARAVAGDIAAAVLLIVFYLAARQAVDVIGPMLPGSAGLWLAIAVACFLLALLIAWALCRAAARVDQLLAEIEQRPTVVDAIDQVGDLADVIEFDFPQDRPRLVLIAGGRDTEGGAA